MQGDAAPAPQVVEPETVATPRPVSMARGDRETGETPKVEDDKSAKRVSGWN